MAVKPETVYLNEIRSLINNSLTGVKLIKLHGSQFMRLGNPDIIGTYMGITFVIETKYVNGVLSEKQVYELNEWKNAGAIVITGRCGVDSPEDIVSTLVIRTRYALERMQLRLVDFRYHEAYK